VSVIELISFDFRTTVVGKIVTGPLIWIIKTSKFEFKLFSIIILIIMLFDDLHRRHREDALKLKGEGCGDSGIVTVVAHLP